MSGEKRVVIVDQPVSTGTLYSQVSAESDGAADGSAQEDRHRRKANFAVLAALQAMKVESEIGFNILTDVDHFFLMRTHTRPPHIPGSILRTPGLQVYEVINQAGYRLYFSVVVPTQCLHLCYVCPHSFVAYVADPFGEEIFKIEADSGFQGSNSVAVVKSSSEVFGKIKQEGDCCTPDYSLTNAADDPLLKVRPSRSVNCFNFCIPVDYVIYHGELAHRIGKVNTHWFNTGVLPEVFHSPHVSVYGVTFPQDLDLPSKVLLLSTLIMIRIFRNEF